MPWPEPAVPGRRHEGFGRPVHCPRHSVRVKFHPGLAGLAAPGPVLQRVPRHWRGTAIQRMAPSETGGWRALR
eukprot:11204960-Lingulodinium_polyedra.AAC.1